MVNFLTVDAVTANVTSTSFAHKLGLTDGPFGIQELESVLNFPERNGRSLTVSIRTSDAAAAVFTILALTFAIDHFLFKSRYLTHIVGTERNNDHAATPNEKASLHEKEALILESGQKCSNDKDSDQEPKSKHDSDFITSTVLPRWVHKATFIVLILFLVAISGGNNENATGSKTHKEILESSSAKAEAEGEADKSPPTSWWGRFVHDHPWSQRILNSAILLLGPVAMLLFVAYHLLFWPWLLTVFIVLQCLFCSELNDSAAVPWQSIALKSTLYLAIWTIVGVTLLLKPNRLQGMLWKCFKWTHAINWWLFWVFMESYSFGNLVARRVGFQYTGIMTEVAMFIIRPSLVAYLYSGAVRDAVVALRVSKYLWNNDITKL